MPSSSRGGWAARDRGSDGAGRSAPAVASVSLSIYEHLRHEIVSGALTAGTRLHQAELARRYGVSITPIREALSALTSDGFVDSNPFSGSVVHQPTLKELDDIYELRTELTPMLVRSAVEFVTPERIARAEALAAAMQDGTEAQWPEANRDFHLALESACDNGQLLATMRRLADLSRGYVALSVASSAIRQRQANDEHVELVRLYKERDVDGAIATSLRHIAETHSLVREVIQQGLASEQDELGAVPAQPAKRR